MSDKDWFFKQFNKLNDKMNISFGFGDGYKSNLGFNLSLGSNWLDMVVDYNEKIPVNLTITVKEFLNPWVGLCYAIIPGRE